jgi:iron complex outermembrane recepter protein
MAHHFFLAHRTPVALAALMALGQAAAQTSLPPVVVNARETPTATVGGWGALPLSQSPFQASVFGAELLRERGVQRLSDITRLDPAVSDAYNSEGYWDIIAVRGFTLDSRFNFRRDGLPINAETSIPLDNKERIELLKGTSGMQAGTSAPGGVVNHVVKRPTNTPLRDATLAWRDRSSVLAAVDLSQRFGIDDRVGLRLNMAAERLDSKTFDTTGHRHLLALAYDWRLTDSTQLEAEVETSRQQQRSVPGFSLLGTAVPTPGDPRINLNNQPWSQPVLMNAHTGSLRATHTFSPQWRASAHLASQRLKTDDRVAFPYGCSAEGNYDRYCSDGTFDLYDFRSDNERRRTDALELAVHGQARTGPIQHKGSAGVLFSHVKNQFQMQAYNWVGVGHVDGTLITPEDPTLTEENTQRSERSTEWFVRDAMQITPAATVWLGLRHSQLDRSSVRTDGSRPTSHEQTITTPWLAYSHALSTRTLAYASWGQGAESVVVPNRARYTNRGEALPALKSRQTELGLKHSEAQLEWGAAWFNIHRPTTGNYGSDCSSDATGDTCTQQVDGNHHHQGFEAQAAWKTGRWTLQGAAQWLRAEREHSQTAALNGKAPPNVPARSLKLQVRHDLAALPGLSLRADLNAVASRHVLPDNSVQIPGYAVMDTSLRYAHSVSNRALVWHFGVDNLFDKRAWKESPYQYDHVYLFPLKGRTLRAMLQMSL